MKVPILALVLLSFVPHAKGNDEVASAMKRATQFFVETLSVHGGYVYFYSLDLERRLGEGTATPSEIWVQPPGTPTVGFAFLEAFSATGDRYYLEAATRVGKALCYGQLQSGGWRNSIEFDPAGKRVDQYRNGKGKGKNNSTLDDGISQSALRFLIKLDAALEGKEESIRDAVQFGLKGLLGAQFPNGAFPQVWRGPVDQSVSVVPAQLPEYDWKTEGRIKEYWDHYTLNDGLAGDVADTLIEAWQVYRKPEYKEALSKLGNFLLLAQLPDPQPGWAQQYSREMYPIWARKFEPPAVAGTESMDVMLTLLKVHSVSPRQEYLDAVVKGVRYFETCLLDDGQISRYYELKTNRPLYMQRKGDVYSLSHDDSNLPSHYGWKSRSKLDVIKKNYRLVAGGSPFPEKRPSGDVQEIIDSLDDQGRWISVADGGRLVGQAKFATGEKYLSSKLFAENLVVLSDWLKKRQGN